MDDHEHGAAGHEHEREHEHDGGHEHGGHDSPPHEPAPPEARRLVPERAILVRGLAFTGLAVAAGWMAVAAVQRTWMLAPAALALGAMSALSAWAAAIHLTGGEKFDDHPFI